MNDYSCDIYEMSKKVSELEKRLNFQNRAIRILIDVIRELKIKGQS